MKRGPKSRSLMPEGLRAGQVRVLGPSSPAEGSGERCKLTEWGPGRSYGKMWFLYIPGLEKSSNLNISQLVLPFLAFGDVQKITLYNCWGSVDPLAPLNDAPGHDP